MIELLNSERIKRSYNAFQILNLQVFFCFPFRATSIAVCHNYEFIFVFSMVDSVLILCIVAVEANIGYHLVGGRFCEVTTLIDRHPWMQ